MPGRDLSDRLVTAAGRPLRESLREGVVVVVSILIAFGLDAWWDHRDERRQEAQIISSLLDEFEGNRETLLADIALVEDYTAAASRLLAAADAGQADGGDVEPQDLWRTLSWRTSNLTTATLDAVISAGHLGIVRDRELRTALAGWPSALDDMAEEEEFEWREITERYRPYLGGLLAVPSLEQEPVPPPDPDDLRRVLRDIRFRSDLAWRLDVSLVSLGAKRDLLARLDSLLRRLRDVS